MNINFALLFCLLFIFSPCFAQVSINGRVTSEGKALGSVRIDLRADSSAKILAYTFSNTEGKYQLKSNHQGNFNLIFSALSYKTESKRIIHLKADTLIDAQLIPGGVQQLEEVLVHAKQPYRRGRDTIELHVNYFLRGDERTVEDLLRKIPGINVGSDGTIKIGSKEVEKVMVEGDDFFEKGYRLLTQNMSVQPLEKVQVLQRYSNNKHLKGIENSDKVALNLELKEDSKSQWLGSVTAQGVPIGPKYYQVGGNLMNFGKKNKYYLLGTANNNGVDAVSAINHLLHSGSADEPGQVGVGITTPTLIDNQPDLPGFDYKRTNFNRDRLVSLNTILNPTPTFKIKWMGFMNPTKKSSYRNTIQEYQIEDIQFSTTENYEFSRYIKNYFSKLELRYEPNKQSTLSYVGNLGSLGQNDVGKLLFNTIASTENSKTQGLLTNHNLTHSYKLSEHEALVSSVRWIAQKSPVNYNIDHFYYEDLFGKTAEQITGVKQRIDNNLQYFGATSHYVSRQKNGNFFEAALIAEYKKQKLRTDFILQTAQGDELHPADFFNAMELRTSNMDILTKYTIKRGKLELTPRLRASLVHNSLHESENQRNRNNLLVSPGLLSKWTIYRNGKLEMDFFFQQKNSSLTELMPNYYSTGIRNFRKGLGDLTTLSSSGGVLTYTHGSMLDRFFTSLSMGHTSLFDYISSESSLNTNFNLLRQIILKDRRETFYKAELNYYLKLLNGNIKLDLGADYAAYETAVEGLGKRQIKTDSYTYGLSFRSVWKSRVNMYTGYTLQHSTYRTEDKAKLENSRGFLNVFLNLGKDWQCNLKNESYRFGSFVNQHAKTYYFSDFSIAYDLKKYKTRFDITAKNILNTRYFRSATLTDTYRSVTEYRLLPFYVSVGIDYSF